MSDWDDERIDVIGQNGNDGLHYKEKKMTEESVRVNEVIDHDDGTSTIKMDIDGPTSKILMKQGLQYLIDEMKMHDKVMVLEPNEFEGDAKTWELSDDDANALFHFGFIYAVKAGMKGMEDDAKV